MNGKVLSCRQKICISISCNYIVIETCTEPDYAMYSSSVKPQRTGPIQVERKGSSLIPRGMFVNVTTVFI